MSLGHSEVSFNHSCLKVPVDSFSRRPSPKYERLSSAKNSQVKDVREKKDEFPLSNLYNNFKSVKSYLHFYENIPDYSELHHLSNEEFYSRLKSLKITQKRFCSDSGVLSSVAVEDDATCGKPFSCCSFDSQNDARKMDNKKDDICVCSSVCLPDKEYCNALDFYDKKPKLVDSGVKQPPPKINIISDNENASDPFELEFKKHSGYEADQESSTLQPVEKLPNKHREFVGDECLLEDYRKRSRSLPISPGCKCESPELCYGLSEIPFRNEGHRSRYGSSYCVSDKGKSSIIQKSKKLHSRPIPLTSRIPLFDKIMMEKEARRRIIHDQYSRELRSLVKPFSFTKREDEKERLRMISSNPELVSARKPPLVRFKAKPIPKNLFSNYAYERMKEDEFYRALKRRIRAEELLKSSSLPPSMALRERTKYRSKSLDFLDYECPKKSWNKMCGYRRTCKNIKKEIEFDEKNSNASQKKKTKSGWMTSNRRVNSATDSSTEISPYESVLEPESRRKSRPHSAFSNSRNNLAFVLRIESARKRLEMEMEERLKENRLKNKAKCKARMVRMTPAWRALSFDKDEDLALRLEARRQEEREKRENHQRLMEDMYGRVHRMPPLFHKERFSDNKNSKRKNFSNEKDSVTFSYIDPGEDHKVAELCEDLGEEEKKKVKAYSSPASMELNEKYGRKFSESTGSCDKSEKDKAYESDEAVWQNET